MMISEFEFPVKSKLGTKLEGHEQIKMDGFTSEVFVHIRESVKIKRSGRKLMNNEASGSFSTFHFLNKMQIAE